jgi:hypothetical protein
VIDKKIIVTTLVLFFVLSFIHKSYTLEVNSDTHIFYHHDEAGLIINVEAPASTDPGQTINVSVSFHCYTANMSIRYLYVTIFDFRSGQEKMQIENITHVPEGAGYKPKSEETQTQTYNVEIPEDAWDITYGEISCQWELPGHDYHIHNDGFTMTYVRNVEMAKLTEQLTNKTQEYNALSQNYTELNQTYAQLNQTYWDLILNKTSGTDVQLENTRLAMVIFIVTTAFFAATTLYLVIKKPRQY